MPRYYPEDYFEGNDWEPVSWDKSKDEKSGGKEKEGVEKKVEQSLGTKIRYARSRKDMTSADLAQAMHMKLKTLLAIESDNEIPDNTLIAKFEKKLGCKLPRHKN
jgi:ribosome-binding protein aMBF1 (putative translation factor)